MKARYLLGSGAALAMVLGGAEANAQLLPFFGGPPTYYIGPEGGWTSLSNQKDAVTTPSFLVNGVGPFNNFDLSARYNSGFNVGARAGAQWGPWRLEEEYSYRKNGLSSLGAFFGPNINTAFSGIRHTHSLMTNFIYDFSPGWAWPITPHIGFGIGAVNNVDGITLRPTNSGPTPLVVTAPGVAGAAVIPANSTLGGRFLNGSSWNFGYQAIAGFRYDISPLLAFDLDYRYLASTQPSLSNKGQFPFPPAGFPAGTTTYKSGYNTQNIVASLTMKFGPPPPPPPPPTPPAPLPPPRQQVYLVFFDWDKYNITPEGMQIIQLAANQYKAGGSVRLTVTGYTDTSGSPGYNQRLSERRANAVANALVRLGVARSDMAISGRGENDLRVPTPDGVREPQNRRVEIVFP